MCQLMKWHFDVQNGMYFDCCIVDESWNLLLSNIIEDEYWNYAIFMDTICCEQDLNRIEQVFIEKNRKSCIYIQNIFDKPELVDFINKNGYTLVAEEAFMVYSQKNNWTVKKSNVVIKRVFDSETKNDFVEVFTSAYGGDKTPEQPYGELEGTYIQALIRSFDNYEKFYHYVCYNNNVPVAVATLCFVDGKGGVYNVGTNPKYRGNGYGTEVTKACIDEWEKLNGDVLFLQTERGSIVEKWYSNLGFNIEFIGSTFCKE